MRKMKFQNLSATLLVVVLTICISYAGAAEKTAPSEKPIAASGRVKFQKNRLLVDGKPFFFLGTDGILDSLAAMKAHHFNTALIWDPDRKVDLLDRAESADMMLIPSLPGPKWAPKYTDYVKKAASKNVILSWNIGDDLNSRHAASVWESIKLVRSIDRYNRPINCDVWGPYLDYYVNVADMPSEYYYPLLHDQPLKYYKDLLLNGREELGFERFYWTWVQTNMQVWYSKEIQGLETNWGPGFAPDPEQVRILTYLAMGAGSRGIIYFHWRFLKDDWFGNARYAEIAIIGCELDVIGPMLAQGDYFGTVKFSQPDVDASVIKVPEGFIVLLTKLGDGYRYQVGAADVKPGILQIPLPVPKKGFSARLLDFGQTQALAVHARNQMLEVDVPAFDLTAVLLISTNEELLEQKESQMKALLPDAAKFAIEVAEGKEENVRKILGELKDLNVIVEAVQSIYDNASTKLQATRLLARNGDLSSAYNTARLSSKLFRTAQRDLWEKAVADEKLARQGQILNFHLLPQYYRDAELEKDMVETANLFPEGSFEPEMDSTNSRGQYESEYGRVEITGDFARTGKQSCRMVAKKPTIRNALPKDVASADFKIGAFPVKKGEIIEAEVWVFVPDTIRHTRKGGGIRLEALDKDGQVVATHAWVGIAREKGQFLKTDRWQRIRVRKKIVEPNIASVDMRLFLCGQGECYFDDASVKKIVPATQN